MADIYRSISIGSIPRAQAEALREVIFSVTPNPSVMCMAEWSPDTNVLTYSVGIPSETPLPEITSWISAVRAAVFSAVGRFPNAAVTISPGDKCMTARDRRGG